MVKNKRIALAPGTMLTDDICIVSLISDAGGSSLVYKAKKKGNNTIIKEFFPYESNIEIMRDVNGYRLVPGTQSHNEIENYRKQLRTSFENELNNAQLANEIRGNNSIYSFPCSDINGQVQKNELFRGSLGLYMEIETKSGMTLLDEIDHLRSINQSHDVDFEQAILLTIKILNALSSKHSIQHLLHLDLKPDNVYFFDEPNWKDTICVFLDCGNYQPIGKVTSSFGFSATRGYAAFEITKILKYLKMKSDSPTNNELDSKIEKYTEYIGTQTDTYSVGMMFYQLLMGNDFDLHVFYDINSTSSQKKLTKLIKESLEKRFRDTLPYVIDKLLGILSKALFIPRNYDDLIEKRYTSCDAFIKDLNGLLEIYEMRGIHPEIIEANSRKEFMNIVKLAGISVTPDQTNEELINNDTLFDSRLFPEAFTVTNN